MKVAAVQCVVGKSETFSSAEKLINKGIREGVELFLLPEYFSYMPGKADINRSYETMEFMESLSHEFCCLIAGNVLLEAADRRGYINALHIYDSGDLIGVQEKIHPTDSEREMGVVAGTDVKIFSVRGVKIAALVCADILYPEVCRVAALKGAEIILNPVVSAVNSELPGKGMRHCLYFTRAFDNSCVIVKAGGPGVTFLGSETAGRSLIATPKGIKASFKDEGAEELVYCEVDIEEIRRFRELNYSLRERNTRAYRELL
jgi:predicted amidohydrolase